MFAGVRCTKLVLEDTVETIGDSAFNYGLTSLTGNLIIPSSVKTIGENAFNGCYGFDKVYIPNTVTSMGKGAFNIGVVGKRTEIYVDFDYYTYVPYPKPTLPSGWSYYWTNYRYGFYHTGSRPHEPFDYNSLYVCWRGWGLNVGKGYYGI